MKTLLIALFFLTSFTNLLVNSCSILPPRRTTTAIMSSSYEKVASDDNGPFQEYSVIYTDRALNLMSPPFCKVMKDLSECLKSTYNGDKVAIIPGSGTFAMEAVARQFATNQPVLVVRNGWFSFRWTEIFEFGEIPSSEIVLKAQPVVTDPSSPQYAPMPIDAVVNKIAETKPAVVFMPHVETSTGMIVSDDYITQVAHAVHDVGGLLVLDCIASGTVWADMKKLGIDVLISAPQKGWSGPACCGMVVMSQAAVDTMMASSIKETSFALSLKKWTAIMEKYEGGAFGYHTTMPTDALRDFHNVSVEMMNVGMDQLKEAQVALGRKARMALSARGLVSVAASTWEAPGVLVFYTPPGVESMSMVKAFKEHHIQIAAGVPFEIDEPAGTQTFRIGLFGIDKLKNVDKTVRTLESALDKVLEEVTK